MNQSPPIGRCSPGDGKRRTRRCTRRRGPDTRGAAGRWDATANSATAFVSDTAAKSGKAERTVRLDAARGRDIAPEVLSQIAGTKLDTGRDLRRAYILAQSSSK
jgi:hypothetical protein